MELLPLTLDNVAYAVGLAQEMHKLSTFNESGPEFDWEHCSNAMRYTLDNPNYFFMLAHDGDYVGAVCGRVIPFYFSPKLLGVEEAWYVREGTKYRASIGMRLMESFVTWCYDKGATMVQSGDVAGIRTVGVDALYRHMGFTRYGSVYKYVRVT